MTKTINSKQNAFLPLYRDFGTTMVWTRVTLFDKKNGFHNKYELVLTHGASPVQDRVSQFVFKDIQYGRYDVGVFHDEDGNGNLKSKIIVSK